MSDAAMELGRTWHVVAKALGVFAMSKRPVEVSVTRQQDESLVLAALSGDGEAFGKIIEQYQATIASQMRRFSRDQNDIEELTHDVFVEAYVSLKSYRANSPLIHWLRKIALRVGYRYWERRTRSINQTTPLLEIKESLQQFVENEGAVSASDTLGDLLELLSPPDRLVLTLIYWDNCSVSEAAELAGWSQSKVKVQAFRARKRLRKLIEESLK